MKIENFFDKYVCITVKKNEVKIDYTGYLLNFTSKNPNKNKSTVYFLKLDTGYNIGFFSDNILDIKEILKESENLTETSADLSDSILSKPKLDKDFITNNFSEKFDKKCYNDSIKNKNFEKSELTKKKIISLLHTGGTIASKVDYKTGAVTARFEPEELISMFPKIQEYAEIRSRRIANVWSQDLRFDHYNIIAKEIEKEIKKGVDGIIIGHGTDTLHFSSAALSFMLENLKIPIIFVGSQRSSDRGSSDAGMNLINASYFISESDFSGVAICMHNSSDDSECAILPANRTKKMHSSRRDAFKAINDMPIALVDYTQNKIEFLKKDYQKKESSKYSDFKLKLFKNVKVGVIKQVTNMDHSQFLFFKDYDGLVIESTGLGNLPITEFDEYTKENKKIFDALKQLVKNDVVVVLSPETTYGKLNLNVYENARRQQDIGLLGNYNDMTTETTYIKLAWLLSNYSKEETKKLIMTNMCGELKERTEYDDKF